ncbi:pentapeptide repeat-containing protein [Parasphingorhabdus sp. JC815]
MNNCKLEYEDLSKIDLSGEKFELCNLRSTNLAGANLEDTT